MLRITFQNQLRQAASPYARPTSGTAQAKPPITQKYEDLVNVIEELGKDVRPTYAGSKRFVYWLWLKILKIQALNGIRLEIKHKTAPYGLKILP